MDADRLIKESEKKCEKRFFALEEVALKNQKKVLDAFTCNKISLRHFAPTTGYAYSDTGREALSNLFAEVFVGQKAIVSPLFMSGTHTISTALFGILRPNDTVLSITGEPYSTLKKVIGCQSKTDLGSLKDFNIDFKTIELTDDGKINTDETVKAIKEFNPKIVYIQRAKGYAWRKAFSIAQISAACKTVKAHTNAYIIVDNCYGEFVEESEPLEVGADLIMGSLIKNPGGGLAPSGGYIVGLNKLIEKIEGRYSAPGVGFEIGAYPFGYQYFFQGLFMAPHVVLQAMKASLLFSEAFNALGYEVLGYGEMPTDITCCIKFNSADKLTEFCRAVQRFSPVDSHAVPYASDMPGYVHPIIMAGGSFVQGASIELSADAPVVEPYIGYMQGSLTYQHSKLVLAQIIKSFKNSAN